MKTRSIVIGTLIVLAGTQTHANLIVNGSFEAPIVSGFQIFNSIPGWTTTFGSGIEVQRNIVGLAYHGNQLVELASLSNSGMVQQVPTSQGQTYQLVFAYSPRPGMPPVENRIEVLFDNVALASITGNGVGLSNTRWSNYTFTVVANRTQIPLEFRATGTNQSFGGLLDDVRLNILSSRPQIAEQPVGVRVPGSRFVGGRLAVRATRGRAGAGGSRILSPRDCRRHGTVGLPMA